jgi:hypothetical protein
MRRSAALRRSVLVLCSFFILGSRAGAEITYVEDFRTGRYLDRLNTTAMWDTLAGELKLPPYRLALIGSAATPSAAYGVAVDGHYAYVANSTSASGLEVIDITNSSTPVSVGHWSTSGRAYGVAISGNYAFVATGTSHKLVVVDITNPANPVGVDSCLTPNIANAVAIDGDSAYVADAWSGLQVISIADPRHIYIRGQCPLPGNASAVAVSGSYAFVSLDAGLYVVKIRDPGGPTVVGSCATSGAATNVAISGDFAYVSGNTWDLQVINIADPTHPSVVASWGASGQAYGIAVDEDRAYITDVHQGLLVIDITDPLHPAYAGGYTLSNAQRAAVVGEYAYVGCAAAGLKIVRVASPVAPALVGGGSVPSHHIWRVAVSGNYAYAATVSDGLQVFSIANPLTPILVGGCAVPHAVDIAVSGDYAYVARQDGGLSVLDIADPSHPTIVGSIPLPHATSGVVIAGSYAYVASMAELVVININYPMWPRVAGSCPLNTAVGLAVSGDHAYVACEAQGLQVVSIADPMHPAVVGSCVPPGDEVVGVAVSGDWAYVVAAYGGLITINIADPAHPTIAGSCASPGSPSYVAVVGERAYVPGQSQLVVIDVANPAQPSILGACGPLAAPWGEAVSGDHVYVAESGGDLKVVEVLQRQCATEANVGRSLKLNAVGSVSQVRLSATQTDSIRWDVTADGGVHWQTVAPDGSWATLAHPGSDLRWQSTHYYLGGYVNPTCTLLEIGFGAPGACCSSTGLCLLTDQAGCPAPGVWHPELTSCTPDPCPLVDKTLCEIGAVDPVTGIPILLGAYVRCAGLALCGSGTWQTNNLEFQMTDGQCCITVFRSGATIPVVNQGDQVQVVGTVGQFNGKEEIEDAVITVLSTGNPLPPPTQVSTHDLAAHGEDYENCLIKAHCVQIVGGNPWPPAGSNASVLIDDGSGPTILWIDKETNIDGSPVPVGLFDAVGIATQFDSSQPYTGGYEIEPRGLGDLSGCVGVCCDPTTGQCTVTTPSLCVAPRDWHIEWTTCSPNPCPTSGVPAALVGDQDGFLGVVPNPFAGSTGVWFRLPKAEPVRLEIFDAAGHRVQLLEPGRMDPGIHDLEWDGLGPGGDPAVAGVYFVRLSAGEQSWTRTLIRIH